MELVSSTIFGTIVKGYKLSRRYKKKGYIVDVMQETECRVILTQSPFKKIVSVFGCINSIGVETIERLQLASF